MAKITFGAVVAGASGCIAGIRYARNKSGPYVAPRTLQADPTKGRRALIQTNLDTLSTAWRDDLTDAQRRAWYLYDASHPTKDRFGVPRPVGARQAFCRTNARLLNASETTLLDPPASNVCEAVRTVSATGASPPSFELLVTFAPAPSPSTHVLEIWASEPTPITRYAPTGLLRWLAGYSAGQTSPVNITAEYTARFTEPATPCAIHIAATLLCTTNGVRSQRFNTRVLLS